MSFNKTGSRLLDGRKTKRNEVCCQVIFLKVDKRPVPANNIMIKFVRMPLGYMKMVKLKIK